MAIKLYAVVSREALTKMGGNRGKMTAQTGHAFLHAWWDASVRFADAAAAYRNGNARKVTLITETDEELHRLVEQHRPLCGVTTVIDAGLTVFKGEPTLTCIGIGPIDEELVSAELKALKALV